MKNNSSSQMT